MKELEHSVMRFTETKIRGAYIIDIERREDHRGFFARGWCQQEFADQGLATRFVQTNVGFNHKLGTLRGMHWQSPPYQEVKLVRCTKGRVVDTLIDLRPGSPTHGQWVSVELTADNHTMLYIPEGCAHGYQTLENKSEVVYDTSQFYAPSNATGVLYNDPAFGIEWPLPVSVISEADSNWLPYRSPQG
jgi:dTDP-4-dehydrorhamnose 3,5-epimerase